MRSNGNIAETGGPRPRAAVRWLPVLPRVFQMRGTVMIATASEAAARAEKLVKRYGSGQAAVTALDGVSIEIPARSFTAAMGPAGSGKSTLLHCMAGLGTPDSGRVWIGGAAITPLPDPQLTRGRTERV